MKKPSIHGKSGFTIVELLIVIVVIAILAAITLVAYNGVTIKAHTAAVQSDLSNVARLLGNDNVTSGTYPSTLSVANNGMGIPSSASDGTTYSYHYSVTDNSYCVTATNSNISYYLNSTTQTIPTAGACSGDGVNGNVVNLEANPSLETDSTGWSYRWYGTAGGAGTNSRQTNGGYNGSAYLHKVWTTAGAAEDDGFNTSTSAVSAGVTYTASAYLRTNRSDVPVRASISWEDSNGNSISPSAASSTITLPSNTWTRSSVSGTAPTGAVKAYYVFTNYTTAINWAVGDTFDLDAAMVTQGPTLYTYADGNTPGWTWSGTKNESTSTGPVQ